MPEPEHGVASLARSKADCQSDDGLLLQQVLLQPQVPCHPSSLWERPADEPPLSNVFFAEIQRARHVGITVRAGHPTQWTSLNPGEGITQDSQLLSLILY